MGQIRDDVKGEREAEYDINPIFLNRWSPRALSRDMSDEDLKAMFEAARWAPSSYNNQHWRFLYATYKDEDWEMFEGFVNDFNSMWAEGGYALIVVVSNQKFEFNGEPAKTHSFDTGAAWENFALEAADRDLVAHGMQGFDYEKAREQLDIPDQFEVEMMIAVGSKGDKEKIEQDARVEPKGRKEMEEIVTRGTFDF